MQYNHTMHRAHQYEMPLGDPFALQGERILATAALATAAAATPEFGALEIGHPCGHQAPLDASAAGPKDFFVCPKCGCRWHVETAPATRKPSGFVVPGARRVVVDERGTL